MNTTKRISVMVLSLCLSCAAYFGPPVFARQNSATPDVEREFFDAIKKGDAEKVGELLKQRPTLIQARTKNGTTPVLFAVFTDHREMAESLLAAGIEPNIFEAAATGRVERIRALLKSDPALVKAYSPDGWTALHLNWGNPQVAELLLDSGADINAVSKNRFIATPLQSALAAQWTAVARLLIARGANVNCRGDGGFSPLHEAASSGQLEIARLLLKHGAKLDARTDDGKTPLDIAVEFKQDEVAKLLRGRKGNQ